MSAAEPLGGRYRLGEVIGRGGMSEVLRAEDLKLHRQVAVKVLHDSATDERDRERFFAEARTLAMLSHAGLVTVYDAGLGDHERPFLVMELVEGQTLGEQLASGPLLVEEVASVGAQVADALAYVHDHGIVHRDVKPGNILGSGPGVKLADFGIARLVEQATRHTRTGFSIGTAAYLAPEQVRGEDVTGAADVYALGLVLLESLTGRREYPGLPTEAALARLTRMPTVPAGLPAPWPALLTRMLRTEPAERPSAAEVARALRGEVLDAGPPTEPFAAGDRAARRRTRRAAVVAGLGAALLVVAAVLVAAGIGNGTESADTTDIPANTPARLREPLTDLHVAVQGEAQ
ncbi:MAG TPA: serine/threonine-protein kinase [Nocardioides sp.]|nr:serine/threonine-protein kinase [Nocardioides sp.]